jgi:hypothetical protein
MANAAQLADHSSNDVIAVRVKGARIVGRRIIDGEIVDGETDDATIDRSAHQQQARSVDTKRKHEELIALIGLCFVVLVYVLLYTVSD